MSSAQPKDARSGTARPGRPGGKREQNRLLRTHALLDAAVDLFLQAGIDNTTIDEITRAAGVAKGSFYRYFDDKPQLVEKMFGPVAALVEEAFEEAAQALQEASAEDELNQAYAQLAGALGAAFVRFPKQLRLYLQENRGPRTEARAPILTLSERVTGRAVGLTDVGLQQGLLRPFTPSVSTFAVIGAVERLLLGVLREEALGNPLAIPGQLIDIVLNGVRLRGSDEDADDSGTV